MKRLPVLVCVLLAAASAFAFDTTRAVNAGPRIGILRPPVDPDPRVQAAVERALASELRARGYDAIETGQSFDDVSRDDRNDVDYYVELVGDSSADGFGGIDVGSRAVDVSLELVVSRVAAELRVYDARNLEVVTSQRLAKKNTALMPTGVGVGGRSLFAYIALGFVQRAQLRNVTTATAREAATRVAAAIGAP
ncbi:MAG: hypothetical protein JO197_08230 [Acidobacteria bacterium]|nr:hypothetical protein [Acidobacteriota bacterium]MBV9475969.1 hypothetical protein [Acidobacteriota bacterium]